VLVARRGELLAGLARDLANRHGVETRVLALDLAQPEAVDRLVGAVQDLDLGLLVASAGFGTSGPFREARLASELEMIDVNCRAVAELSHHFAGRFARRGRGGIVLMSSIMAFQGVPSAANYAATKAYVQALAEGLRVELAPQGVDVLASAPGPVHTGFAARARLALGRGVTPEVVARQTLRALGRRGTIRPGWLSKVLEASLATLPRRGRVRVMGAIVGGMVRGRAA
jgi:short-subunit dehydrogenase